MNQKLMLINVDKLEPGMILGQTIYDSQGNVLLSKGVNLRESYINKLKDHGILKAEIVFNIENSSLGNDEEVNGDILATRHEAIELIKDTMKRFEITQSIENIRKIIEMVNRIIEELFQNEEIVINLTKLRSLDEYTFEHSINVCMLSLLMGIKKGFGADELRELGIGAFLHDIGKILIPREILNKPSTLTKSEYEIVKKHTTYGYDILKNNDQISETAVNIVLSHHERSNGKGYPNGKKSENTHTFSKIVALADVFDALTSDRIYKRKTDVFNAIEYIINMSEEQFDKDIVHEFIYLLGIYPTGSIVRLNTKEVGMIVKTDKLKPRSPTIKVLLDNKGKRVKDYLEVDMQKNPSVFITDYIPHSTAT